MLNIAEELGFPSQFPVRPFLPALLLAQDREELAAAEAFNREMAELEDLEHHEELRMLLQDRINGNICVRCGICFVRVPRRLESPPRGAPISPGLDLVSPRGSIPRHDTET